MGNGLAKLLVAVVLALVFAGTGHAAPKLSAGPKELQFSEVKPADLAVIVEGWREKFQSSDVLIKGAKAKTYAAEVDQFLKQLDELESWDGLSESKRIEIANSYEQLRAQTDGGLAAGTQRKCSQEKRLGSNLRTTVCVTAAEQARRDKANLQIMGDINRNGRRQETGGN